ncbi:(d)CMP kinase [Yanghanlia caeni]|uniref:Cytidylate kinase n=1 Tax=Yanghanlia caeni TaxID=3064283 RepID=A0ABU1D3B6_9BURK|nr:(d)CMP kinase [Alcaligenaceae bacterium LG-2]
MSTNTPAPVITIDGPTASGKGTIASLVADRLGWAVLDSGALYRLTALSVLRSGVNADDVDAVAQLARTLNVTFDGERILLDGEDVAQAIRKEDVGNLASRIAAYQPVREALLQRQRDFRQAPGLVADGRDMGTVVFPDAPLKIFLVANVRARAERRYKQLMEKGFSVKLTDLLEDMQARDARDAGRANAPLVAAADAVTIDSSGLSIDQTVSRVLALWSERQP